MLSKKQKPTIAIILLCLAPALFSAEHRGIVRFNDLPVPGASITAAQGEKKFIAVTDLEGVYSFADLANGTWTILVEMHGFQPIKREVQLEQAGSDASWDLTMLPLSEMKAEVIKAAQSNADFDVPKTDAKQTPEITGTAPQSRESTAKKSPFAGLTDKQLEDRAADGFLINGSANNGAASPFAQLAAFGNNRFTRSLYNGSLNLHLNNDALDARSYSLLGKDAAKQDYNQSTMAFNLGGPLVIPYLIEGNTTLYLGYERTRNRNATIMASRMPTEEERAGDLSRITDSLGQQVQILDPETGIPFKDNVIPGNRISPQARSLLSLFPFPNYAGSGRYNYQVPIIAEAHSDAISGRIYRTPFSINFNYRTSRADNPNAFGFLDTGKDSSYGVAATYSWNFGRLSSLNMQGQLDRSMKQTTPFFANRVNISQAFGISGNDQTPTNWGPPNLLFSNFEGLTESQESNDRNMNYGLSSSLRLSRKSHYITIGADFKRQQLNASSQQNARGSYTFTGAATGYDFADFLLGIPDTASIAFGNADKYFRSSRYALYINDDWRVNSALTLNGGIRWEYEAPFVEKYNRLVSLDIASDFSAIAPVIASSPSGELTKRNYPRSLINPDKRGVQPRIGFAWRPFAASSLVIRSGYGIYRDSSAYQTIATNRMAQQAPLSKSFRIENTSAHPLSLANAFDQMPLNAAATFAIDPDFRPSYSHNWQLLVQRDLPFSLQAVLAYMGVKGTHLSQSSLPNTYPEGAANQCASCPSGFQFLSSNGASIRHSGQIQLRRRLSNGMSANLQYTYSKSIDDASLGGNASAQNWLNLKAERALSNFDQRHLLSAQAQYTSGAGIFGPTFLSGWKGMILKEWTFSAQMTIGSGLPLTPVYYAAVHGTGYSGSIRPSVTGASVYNAPEGLFLNPKAYAPPAVGEWGNAGRNSITGPKQFALDASLGRAFRTRDRYNIEFRCEAANILNHVTFPSWNTIINSSQFGLPDRANPMRKVQANLRVSF